MAQLKFTKSGPNSFHSVVKTRVDKYFIDNQLSKTGDWRLYYKSIILFLAFAIAYATILVATQASNLWAMIGLLTLGYGMLGFIIPGLGFNVMHDAVHGSYSKNKTLNNWIAFFSGDTNGASTLAWALKHNKLHHTFTNIHNHDEDITQSPMFRISPDDPWFPMHRYQHRYAHVLYCILSLHWSIVNDIRKVVFERAVLDEELKASTREYIRFALGKLVYYSLFILPMFLLPHWWYGLVGFVGMHCIAGYTLSIVFQMAHVVEGTAFVAEPLDGEKIQTSWREHQMRTTANFAMDNAFLTWYVGGLNFQIEHHLFANISHVHYPAISKIVQQTAKEFDVTYHQFDTFKEARQSHFHQLRAMGRKPYVSQAA